MRKLATVLALAATHGLPTPRGSVVAKKDEANDVDEARFLRGSIYKDVDEAVNSGRKPLMGWLDVTNPCGSACDWGASVPTSEDPTGTCGSHISYLLDHNSQMSEAEACNQVAGEHSDACGSCKLKP